MDAHEAAQMHQNFSQQLLQDHIEACSLPEHNLITVSNLHLAVRSVFEAKQGAFAFLCYSFFLLSILLWVARIWFTS